MIALLCVLFAIGCATPDLPETARPPSLAAPEMRTGKLTVPALRKPAVRSASFFDQSCDVQPPDELKQHFYAASKRFPFGASDCELARQACAESGCCDETCDVDRLGEVESPAGAIGVSQFLPETAAELGLDPRDPRESIFGQAEYVKWCRGIWTRGLGGRTDFDIRALGLATYNHGLGNMLANQERNGWVLYDSADPYLPLETQGYVEKIERR